MAAVHKGVLPVYLLPETTMNNSNGPTSRLALMQARFQQKQLEEKEQKLLALYEEQAHKAYQRVGQGGGKVRQLFQERRTHHQPGLDRSYPLEPIYDNRKEPRGASLDRNQNTAWKNQPARRSKSQVRKQPEHFEDDPHISKNDNNYEEHQTLNNSNKKFYYFGDENDYLLRAANELDSSRVFKKLPHIGTTTLAQAYENKFKKDSVENKASDFQNNMSPAKEPGLKKPMAATKMNGVTSLTKSMSKMTTTTTSTAKKTEVKSTTNATTTNTTPRVKSVLSSPVSNSKRTTPSPTSSISSSRPASNTTVKETLSTNSTPKVMKPAAKAPGPKLNALSTRTTSASSAAGLTSCKICSRNFAPDRIKAHEEICAKTAKKKRKVFDPVKQRLKGTEAEPYLRKGKPPPPPPLTKNNWRRKHEDFIANIRAAKVAQAHVAKGGKLSDLPPPPPMDTSDLIPCQHCGRKFNEAAAARHIPKCATMLHNKPKRR